MFTVADLTALVKATPFEPFRIKTTAGDVYTVPHPNLCMVGARAIIIGIPAPGSNVFDQTVKVALIHIVEIQPIHKASPAGGTGSASGCT